MNKRVRHIWLIVAALILVFALLLLLLLCRGCGFLGADTDTQQTTGKTTVGNATENQIDQNGLEQSFPVSFDGVQIDTEPTESAATGTTQDSPDAGQTTTPSTTVPNVNEPTTLPTEQTTPPANDSQPDQLDYEKYMSWSSQQQQKFFDDNFKDDPIAFAQWFQKIKREYEEANPPIVVTGPINIEDYLN